MNSELKHLFDLPITRKHTHCVKWDEYTDEDIIPLWVADMDFAVAPAIQRAILKRAQHPVFGYTHVPQAYFDATIGWYQRRHHWHVEQEWIEYTIGVVPAISVCIKALTEPGDKVLIQTPVYNCFYSSIRNSGCERVENAIVRRGDHFEIDFDGFEQKCADPLVKVFLLCNPHNPVGRVWTDDELKRLNDICQKHGVIVISDEIHGELTFPDVMYSPFGRVSEECLENSVVLCSPSKSFNTAGLQTANIICKRPEWRQKINRVINIYEVCDLNPFGPEALIAAYNESEDWLDALREYIYDNYQALLAFFADHLPQWKVTRMEGTYLAWVDITATGLTSDELTQRLFDQGRVKVSSGTIYGTEAGEGFIRINMACPRAQLMEGLRRICQCIVQSS